MKKALLLGLTLTLPVARAELRIPACTAYFHPDPDGARLSEHAGITGWADPHLQVLWFGELKTPGDLECALQLRLPEGRESKLRLTVAGTSREATARGSSNAVQVAFVRFPIPAAGYRSFTLESMNPPGTAAGQWLELATASFSHDPTGRADRLDRCMGVENGQFFLSHGGFVAGFTKYGEAFKRPPVGQPPRDIQLPALRPAEGGL